MDVLLWLECGCACEYFGGGGVGGGGVGEEMGNGGGSCLVFGREYGVLFLESGCDGDLCSSIFRTFLGGVSIGLDVDCYFVFILGWMGEVFCGLGDVLGVYIDRIFGC